MSTLEKIEQLEKTVTELKNQSGNFNFLLDGLNSTLQKVASLEQSFAALSKTLTAVVAELSDKSHLDGNSVMARIRKMDDNNEKDRVSKMLKSGLIKSVDEVTQSALVVVEQKFADSKVGELASVSDYRVLELAAPHLMQQVKDGLVGKKVGDTVEIGESDNVKHFLTVKEIYVIVEGERQGEQQA